MPAKIGSITVMAIHWVRRLSHQARHKGVTRVVAVLLWATLAVQSTTAGSFGDPNLSDPAGDTMGNPSTGDYRDAADLLVAFWDDETLDTINLTIGATRLASENAYGPDMGVEYEATIRSVVGANETSWWVSARYDGLDGWTYRMRPMGPPQSVEVTGKPDPATASVTVAIPRDAVGNPKLGDYVTIDRLSAQTWPLIVYLPNDGAVGPSRPHIFAMARAPESTTNATNPPPPPSPSANPSPPSSGPATSTPSTTPSTSPTESDAPVSEPPVTSTPARSAGGAPGWLLLVAFFGLAILRGGRGGANTANIHAPRA